MLIELMKSLLVIHHPVNDDTSADGKSNID